MHDSARPAIGTKVRVTANYLGFKIGDIGTVINQDGSSMPLISVNGKELWLNNAHMELVEPEPFFKVGDRVKLRAGATRGYHTPGNIYTITQAGDEISARVTDNDGDSLSTCGDFELATPSPEARGPFKDGDAVRVVSRAGMWNSFSVGDTGTVTGRVSEHPGRPHVKRDSDGRTQWVTASDLELITPVKVPGVFAVGDRVRLVRPYFDGKDSLKPGDLATVTSIVGGFVRCNGHDSGNCADAFEHAPAPAPATPEPDPRIALADKALAFLKDYIENERDHYGDANDGSAQQTDMLEHMLAEVFGLEHNKVEVVEERHEYTPA